MKVLTVKEIKACEAFTLKTKNENNIMLMHRAGIALVKDFLRRVHPAIDANITIIVGIGNNGGDGLVMAIELLKRGYTPKILAVGEVKKASEEFLHYFDLAGKVSIAQNLKEILAFQEVIFASDYIIEGLFGIGLHKSITGYRSELIAFINESDTVVYSIDIPSGINPNNGLVMGKAVKASFTGITGYFKPGNLLNDALDYHGEVEVLDIGILEVNPISRQALSLAHYELKQKIRRHNSNKYSYGLGVFIGGKASMMGAIQLSAISGLKSGLGIVTIISDLKNNTFTQFYPELIITHNQGHESIQQLEKATSVVYGPGISECPNHKLLLDYLLNSDIPLIIDASGLDHIQLKQYKNKHIVLTPHIGEMARLFHVSSEAVTIEPLKYVNQLTALGFNVLLKGPCNILASASKRIFVQVDNTGLATAGSGDVLSGILAARIEKNNILESMEEAVYIHTKAANFAKEKYGAVSMTATNIVNQIYKVMKE